MEIYCFSPSAPCRAVLLFVQALNLDPTLKEINVMKGLHLTPEYLRLNPQHTIPLIVDDNYVLSESRAILVYLAEQYAQGSSYYPNDPKAKGVINQRLMFDVSTLYARFSDAYLSHLSAGQAKELDASKINKLKEAFDFLEAFMGDSYWMAGDEMTIADFSLVATISSIEVCQRYLHSHELTPLQRLNNSRAPACAFDLSKYKKITAWLERCRNEMSDYERINEKGAKVLGDLVKEKLKH